NVADRRVAGDDLHLAVTDRAGVDLHLVGLGPVGTGRVIRAQVVQPAGVVVVADRRAAIGLHEVRIAPDITGEGDGHRAAPAGAARVGGTHVLQVLAAGVVVDDRRVAADDVRLDAAGRAARRGDRDQLGDAHLVRDL